jgi:Zn-dependent protease with chaperone function
MQYILFALLFIYIANWNKVNSMVRGYFVKKSGGKSNLRIKDKEIKDFIYAKTQVKVGHVYLIPSEKLFAYCGGIPKKPLLFISTAAYEAFTGDALDWLVLHEIAHFIFGHSIWITVVQLCYLIAGFFLLGFIHSSLFMLLAVIPLAIILASLAVQTNKEFDILANDFAVKKMDNPKGMKEGAQLLMRNAKNEGITKDTLLMRFFYPWNYGLWNETIHAAEKEIERRKKG